ncbi:MAG TPA: SxtJ family membrane protein [bacterium]|nr:SxtJ family membrane protein [bacterium]HPR86596.1 SxtJ family membrane protein [bacterium]
MSWISDIRSGLQQLPRDSRSLQQFAAVLSSALLLIGAFFFFVQRDAGTTLGIVALLLLLLATALFRPLLLRPLHLAWMALAFALGGLVSRLLLTLLFYVVLTPVGLVLRLFGKDFMQRRAQKKGASYWIRRPQNEKNKEQYQRLF